MTKLANRRTRIKLDDLITDWFDADLRITRATEDRDRLGELIRALAPDWSPSAALLPPLRYSRTRVS